MTVNDKINALRIEMKKSNCQAVIIPSTDPHQSEYTANKWKDREWISSFTGSAGTVIITQSLAGLWTDSRYFLQAEKELTGTEIQLHKLKNQFAPEHLDWLSGQLQDGDTICIDGEDFSKSQYDQLKKYFDPKNIEIKIDRDLVSMIWHDRPLLGHNPIIEHEEKYTGKNRNIKIIELQKQLVGNGLDGFLFSALDDIAWLLNLRGSDVTYNPVFTAYLFVNSKQTILFTDTKKLDVTLHEVLKKSNITISEYEEIISFVSQLPEEFTLGVEPVSLNIKIYKMINAKIHHQDSPVRIAKGQKTESEILWTKEAMIKDGVALSKAFKWLEDNIEKSKISEYDFRNKIIEYRKEDGEYVGESFGSIIGYKGNGAIVHYNPSQESDIIGKDGVLLVDCGAQYKCGTTDITRTIALSSQNQEVKNHFTLVLKGFISLATAHFPIGTTGAQLDTLARQFLWSQGLNYLHGTGHGVGFFLNVHEGPHGFAAVSTERGRTPLLEGMIISNEPGYYLEGQYGIRIENLIAVCESKVSGFLKFENLTLFPIDINLVDEKMLDSKEKSWINHYHNDVYNAISPHIDEAHREWFRIKCKLLN
ncbi:MAG: hypothetical protein RLZZ546_512 [Bacteroidota bacterium]|jgi:Xaa-Pro aminopeptidase